MQPTASHIFGFLFNVLKIVLAGQIDFTIFSKPNVFRTLYKHKVNIQSTETLSFSLLFLRSYMYSRCEPVSLHCCLVQCQ